MKKNPSRPFQVVLDIDSSSCVMRNAMNGILRFARDARDWSLGTIELGLIDSFPPGTVFDGAIVGGSWNARRRSRKALRVRRTVELRPIVSLDICLSYPKARRLTHAEKTFLDYMLGLNE